MESAYNSHLYTSKIWKIWKIMKWQKQSETNVTKKNCRWCPDVSWILRYHGDINGTQFITHKRNGNQIMSVKEREFVPCVSEVVIFLFNNRAPCCFPSFSLINTFEVFFREFSQLRKHLWQINFCNSGDLSMAIILRGKGKEVGVFFYIHRTPSKKHF